MRKFVSFILVCTIIEAIQTLRPGAEWNLRGDQYSGLEWLDKSQAVPGETEIMTAILSCQSQESLIKAQKRQAILDAKDKSKKESDRIDALIQALDLK